MCPPGAGGKERGAGGAGLTEGNVRLAMGYPLLLSVLILTLSSCAGWQDLSMTSGHRASPGLPTGIQTGLSLAVWLEDQCEDLETDARTLTVLELLHDGLVIPPQTLMALSMLVLVGLPWSLYDNATLPRDATHPNRFKQIMDLVGPRLAGPHPGTSRDQSTGAGRAEGTRKGTQPTHLFGCLIRSSTQTQEQSHQKM